jgi:3-isopropylmalate/(R)-2-methylmalate dehydratase small subunit
MIPFNIITSKLVSMPEANVDTDQILPAQYVNVQGKKPLEAALFFNLKAANPSFVLNQPGMSGRSILLSGKNFGCGSSREAAAWALSAGGFRALLCLSFNDTFWNNCVKNGILPVTTPETDHQLLAEMAIQNPDLQVTVDLTKSRVSTDGGPSFAICIDRFVRELLLNGTDELNYLLERIPQIHNYKNLNKKN